MQPTAVVLMAWLYSVYNPYERPRCSVCRPCPCSVHFISGQTFPETECWRYTPGVGRKRAYASFGHIARVSGKVSRPTLERRPLCSVS